MSDATPPMDPRAAELIATLDLQPHPEGGFFREIFRSAKSVTPTDGRETRCALTTIYFLLPRGAISRWHQVRSDEVWHLYEGGPLELFELTEHAESLHRHRLGRVGEAGAQPVCTIPAHHWQAARSSSNYTLVGCTVGPGFEFEDFRMMADSPDLAERLRQSWPDLAELL